MGVLRILIPATLVTYLSFFFLYGDDVFGFDEDSSFETSFSEDASFWEKLAGTVTGFVDVTLDLLRFATFDAFSSQTDLPFVVSVALFLVVGLPWFLILISVATLNGVPSL